VKTSVVQRWRHRRGTYRPAGEPFDARACDVARIPDDTTARSFIVEHHYSGSYPAALHRFGLYERSALVGVAVYSMPMRAEVLRPFAADDGVELGRLVLLDHVRANAESWFVARTFEHLRVEGVAGVVSFSDPEVRTTAEGITAFVGHIGTVYQALNGCYTGRATPRTLRLLPDGTVLSERTLQKIRARERGWQYAVEQLVAHGAAEPDGDLRAWLASWLPRVTRTRRHGGNHRYVFPLSRAARRAVPASLPYPKFDLELFARGT
jgi:hypothetical protein